MHHTPRRISGVLAALVVLLGGPAHAASKFAIAVLGDAAPGGGVFAGPGFTGWPAAAGTGWIGFRGQVSGGTTREAMVLAHLTPPVTRVEVASIGDTAPDADGMDSTASFKQFVGRPVVGANGDLAFLAELTRGADDPEDTRPAGIFLFHGGKLAAVVRTNDGSTAGTIDLLGPVDPSADPTEVVERSPTINDAGDVAFLARTVNDTKVGGAIFLARVGQKANPLVQIGDHYDGGAFATLAPPALNNRRTLAFHAMVATPDEPADGIRDGMLDGIFTVGPDGAPAALLVAEGATVNDQHIHAFADDVALDAAGDVVFTAGPLSNDPQGVGTLDSSQGIVRYAGGVLTAVAVPGQLLGVNRISGFHLDPANDSVDVPPALGPDGHVAFLASLDGGSREAIGIWDGNDTRLIYTGGVGPDPTPAGGVYAGAGSAPALDANGAVVFRARIAGGTTSEAVVYQPPTGAGIVTVVGEAVPSEGFFAGAPFSAPAMNDRGDVAFRAFVARGTASVGIFRFRDGALQALVRAGDPAPGGGTQTFLDLLGTPSLNASGAVAFVGQLPATGLGVYVADDAGVRKIVAAGDRAPDDPTAQFKTIATAPALNDAGDVAFRATTVRFDPLTGDRVGQDAIFVSSGGQLRRVVAIGDGASVGDPFFRLRDPSLTPSGGVVFRASLGVDKETATGIFLADGSGIHVEALEKTSLGGGVTLSRITGDAAVAGADAFAFVATRSRQVTDAVTKSLGPSILRATPDGLSLVIAQDMPGPAGGTFRNLSAPAASALGHLAFRASFLPSTGGVGGIFLAGDGTLDPYLTIGEGTPDGGRFTSFGNRLAINAYDDVAFTAATSGTSRAGIFVASQARLQVRHFALRIARNGKGRVQFALALEPGRLSNGIDAGQEPVLVTVSDARGTLWSANVNPKLFKRRGRLFVGTPKRKSTLARHLRTLALGMRNGTAFVSGQSNVVQMMPKGSQLQAPIAVTLQVGDDASVRALPCLPGAHGLQCKAS